MAAVARPANHNLPCAVLNISGVSYGDGVLLFRDEVKRLRSCGVVRSGHNEPQRVPIRVHGFGLQGDCRRPFRGYPKNKEGTISLQISGEPQRVRTADDPCLVFKSGHATCQACTEASAIGTDGVDGPPSGDNRYTARDAATDPDGRTEP